MGLNLPAISIDNLKILEEGLLFCVNEGIPGVRTHVDLADCSGPEWDLTAVQAFGKMLRESGVRLTFTCIAQVPNSLHWRNKIVSAGASPTEARAWQTWKSREGRGFPMDWKNYLGVHRALWTPLAEAFRQIVDELLPDCVILENEPGNTRDAARSQWGTKPVGYVSEDFKEYAYLLTTHLADTGAVLYTPSMECDDQKTAITQYVTGYGLHNLECDGHALNWYATPADVKPTAWAENVARQVDKLVRALDTGKDVILSELNAPVNAGIDYFYAARDILGKQGRTFYWHDYKSKQFGLKDY